MCYHLSIKRLLTLAVEVKMKKFKLFVLLLVLSLTVVIAIGGCNEKGDKESSGETSKEKEIEIPELVKKYITIPKGVKPTKSAGTGGKAANKAELQFKSEPSIEAVLDKFNKSLKADGYTVKMGSGSNDFEGVTLETKVLDAEKMTGDGKVTVRIQGTIEHEGEDSVAQDIIMLFEVHKTP